MKDKLRQFWKSYKVYFGLGIILIPLWTITRLPEVWLASLAQFWVAKLTHQNVWVSWENLNFNLFKASIRVNSIKVWVTTLGLEPFTCDQLEIFINPNSMWKRALNGELTCYQGSGQLKLGWEKESLGRKTRWNVILKAQQWDFEGWARAYNPFWILKTSLTGELKGLVDLTEALLIQAQLNWQTPTLTARNISSNTLFGPIFWPNLNNHPLSFKAQCDNGRCQIEALKLGGPQTALNLNLQGQMDIQRLWPLTLGPYEFKIQAQLSPWIESQLKLFLAMAENYKVTINPQKVQYRFRIKGTGLYAPPQLDSP